MDLRGDEKSYELCIPSSKQCTRTLWSPAWREDQQRLLASCLPSQLLGWVVLSFSGIASSVTNAAALWVFIVWDALDCFRSLSSSVVSVCFHPPTGLFCVVHKAKRELAVPFHLCLWLGEIVVRTSKLDLTAVLEAGVCHQASRKSKEERAPLHNFSQTQDKVIFLGGSKSRN